MIVLVCRKLQVKRHKMEQLMDRQALLQDKIDALGAMEIDAKLEIAMQCQGT
jgi:hypothetical protein